MARRAFNLNQFATGQRAFVALHTGEERVVTLSPQPIAVGNYVGIALVGDDPALFDNRGRLNTGLEMYMKSEPQRGFANVYRGDHGGFELGKKIFATAAELDNLKDSGKRVAIAEVSFDPA